MSELLEEVEDCLLVTWRFAVTAAALLKVRLVGEANAARDGLSPALVGLVSPALVVEMGVRPRRELWRLVLAVFQADVCDLVLREPDEEVVGFVPARGSLAGEEGGRLIDTVRTSRLSGAGCLSVFGGVNEYVGRAMCWQRVVS